MKNSVAYQSQLASKVNYFRRSSYRDRSNLNHFINKLSTMGTTAMYGGILRDIYLLGNRGFSSDVDLVIHNANPECLERFMSAYEASRNRYGGYRAQIGSWMVDVWRDKDTWAHKRGFVNVDNLKDLTRATFFNWDAAVYDITNEKLFTKQGYEEEIKNLYLDINLEENPNPLGNAIRAIRMAFKYKAKMSFKLINYLDKILQEVSDAELVYLERQSHQNYQIFSCLDLAKIRNQICHAKNEECDGLTIYHYPIQVSFNFLESIEKSGQKG